MKKIMLCCNAGMSTSLLVQKMQANVKERRIPVEVIPMADYGRMNAAGIIDAAVAKMA